MIEQRIFTLKPRKRGFHLITGEVLAQLPPLPQTGLLNLFVQHTSCALSINENYDPSVRADMEQIYNRLVREDEPSRKSGWKRGRIPIGKRRGT